MTADNTTQIRAACHCGQLSVSVNVPNKALPAEIWLCACTTCRKLTGQLNVTFLWLPKVSGTLQVQGNASRYVTSTGPAGCTRCFCPTCGALVFDESPDPTRLGLYAGALATVEGIAELKGIKYVDDCKDRGIAEWLPYLASFPTAPETGRQYKPVQQSVTTTKDDDKLRFRCLCGGVDFCITRPGPESRVAPFFAHPLFQPGVSPHDPPNPDDHWWIRDDGTKWATLLCTCNSCRQTNGGTVQPWVYVPIKNIVQMDGSPATMKMGTLREYCSSAGNLRYFCRVCSATTFFVREGDEVIDISVGLAEADSGARAEEWFAWTHIVGFTEFAQSKALAHELGVGMLAWAQRTGKSTYPLQQ